MEISDQELMQRIKDGDMLAFDCLVHRWEHRLFNIVFKITNDYEITRDICQEVFLQVYQSAKKYRPLAQFETWLYRIAVNRSINELKKQKRYQSNLSISSSSDEENSFPDSSPQPDEIIQQNEVSECIQNALAKLPTDLRIIVILKHYEGLKFQQIAEIVNCPLGTVKSRMYTALDHLRVTLKHIL